MKVNVPTCLPKTMTVDVSAIWVQLVHNYELDVEDIEFISQPGGKHVYCFTITWHKPSPMERYFIGDSCDTLEEAKRNLSRKAIGYFQILFGFTVKDANLNRMRYSKMQCGFQRARYIAARERHVCVVSDLESIPVFDAAGYHTPEGPSYGITSGLTLPPAPKRHRPVCNGKPSFAENHDAENHDAANGRKGTNCSLFSGP